MATADWLEKNLIKYIEKYWQGKGSSAESDITDAFIKVHGMLSPSADLPSSTQYSLQVLHINGCTHEAMVCNDKPPAVNPFFPAQLKGLCWGDARTE